MCISASDLIFAKSVMSTRIKYQKGGVCLPFDISVRKAGLERIICGADERRWQGLDRVTHKFNRVLLPVLCKKERLLPLFFCLLGTQTCPQFSLSKTAVASFRWSQDILRSFTITQASSRSSATNFALLLSKSSMATF